MPPQIVVVKRPRGGLFAGVRSLPHWLRAIWRNDGEALARLRARASADAVHESIAADRGASLTPVPRRPRLRSNSRGATDCGRCEVCIAACPSHALARETATDRDSTAPLTLDFILDLGRCIGCGICVEICPEAVLELIDAPLALWAPAAGQSLKLALLERTDG